MSQTTPHFSAHIPIPVKYCLGTLVLGRLHPPSPTEFRWPRVFAGEMWRRATRKVVPERCGIMCRRLGGLSV